MRADTVLVSVLLLAAPALAQTAPVVRAGTGRTRTLSDLARERRLLGKPAISGTFSVAGTSTHTYAHGYFAAPSVAAAIAASTREDDAIRGRYADARETVTDARNALAAAERAMPNVLGPVTIGPRGGSGYANAMIARAGALLPYTMRVQEAEAGVAKVQSDAARAGVPGLAR